MRDVRVAVYSIAKNEALHVERWWDSAKDADELVILDTGSTDETAEIATRLGIRTWVQEFSPWRFDTSRNHALALVSADVDYCISLDLDEVLLPGWREEMQKAFEAGLTRPHYPYAWSVKEDGSPGTLFDYDHIHSRMGYQWVKPVHEILVPVEGFEEVHGHIDLRVNHMPDPTKSRGQYLGLLELSVREEPDDERNAYYLGREYVFAGMLPEASAALRRFLDLPTATWAPERARAMVYLGDVEDSEEWYIRAVLEAPGRREPWVALAKHFYRRTDWPGALWAAQRATEIHERPMDYLNEEWAWGYEPWDLAAIAQYRLGMYREAVANGRIAQAMAPGDERLTSNVAYYEEALR